MTKLETVEQTIAAHKELFRARIDLFPSNIHVFHNVHFIVAPKANQLPYTTHHNDVFTALGEELGCRPASEVCYDADRISLGYPVRGGGLRLGSLEFTERLPGSFGEIKTEVIAVLDEDLAKQAEEYGALRHRPEVKTHPLVRKIKVRSYPSLLAAKTAASYEQRFIDGTVRYDSTLIKLHEEITAEQLIALEAGGNPFPKLRRVKKGFYPTTPYERMLVVNVRQCIDDIIQFGKLFLPQPVPEGMEALIPDFADIPS